MLHKCIVPGLVLFIICLSLSLHAQRFRNLNTDFPMGLAEDLYQDHEGFLWIGTVNGLVRFDGYETIAFTQDPNDSTTIPGNNINGIIQDPGGRLWVGLSTYGFALLDPELQGFTRVCLPDSNGICLTDISVNDFALHGADTMWVGTEKGLFIYDTGSQPAALRRYVHLRDDPTSISGTYVIRVFTDSKGRLWIGTSEGLDLYDPVGDRFINFNTNPTFPTSQILDIAEDQSGTIWVSPRFTEERLFKYEETTHTFTPYPDFNGRAVGEFRLAFTPDNDLWISSRGVGAFFVDLATGASTYFNPASPNLHGFRNIYSLKPICDTYGNIWMAGQSVMEWPATGKAVFNINTEYNHVISIFARNGKIWLSADQPYRFDPEHATLSNYLPGHLPSSLREWVSDPPSRQRVYDMKYYRDDKYVLVTTRNIILWDMGADTFKEFPTNYGGPFREFIFGEDPNEIWICGNQGQLIHCDLQTGSIDLMEDDPILRNLRCAARGANGDLWFGSRDRGVFRIRSGVHELDQYTPDHPDPAKRLSDYFINDIALSGGKAWIATNLGLNIIDIATKTATQVRKQDGFSSENILSLLVDQEGMVWMGTQLGLIRYDPESESFRHFSRSDGFLNSTYVNGAAFQDERGWLYFGGNQGVDYFDPKAIGSNAIPPDLYLSKVLVNNEPADTTFAVHHLSQLTLDHTQNFLEIELLALHLTAPEGNQYAYRIPEIDTGWRYLDTRRDITLANLSPGGYTLQAKASNSDGVWCTPRTLLAVTIRPPFWSTWWFITLVVIGLIGLLALGYFYRIRQIENRERLKSEFNKRIAELESKALRAQMNPHFLFNSINSVKSLISQNANEKAIQYLTRFGQLIRQVLSNSEKPFVRLQEELEALRLYLNIEQLRFQNFTYRIDVAPEVNADFIEVPPLILQPYVENAIWHGLMHKENGDRSVVVTVTKESAYLHLSVEDNGIGREKAGQMRMLGNSRKGGMGMRVTGDRLELLRTIYGQHVRLIVTDLKNEGMATGTRVDIWIPSEE